MPSPLQLMPNENVVVKVGQVVRVYDHYLDAENYSGIEMVIDSSKRWTVRPVSQGSGLIREGVSVVPPRGNFLNPSAFDDSPFIGGNHG